MFCRYTLSVQSAKRSSKKKKKKGQHQQQQNATGKIPRSLSADKQKKRQKSSQNEDVVPRSVSMVDRREMAKQHQQKDRLSAPEPTSAAATKVEARREKGAMVVQGEREKSRPVSEEVRGKRASLPGALKTHEAEREEEVRKSGEVQTSADIEPAAREEHVQVIAKELPISEAMASEPTVTTFKPEVRGEGESVTTTSLVISEKTGKTTVTMQQVRTWSTSRI